jgi:DNA-binding Xre family transcriptional regulator
MFRKSEKFILIGTFVFLNSDNMTELGLYLSRKSINRSEVSRKTGISKTRLSELTNNKSTKLRVDELYLIALAIDVDPCEVMNFICKKLKLEA